MVEPGDDDKIITTMSPLVTEGVYLADGEHHLHRQQQLDGDDDDNDDYDDDGDEHHRGTGGFIRSFPMPIPKKKQQVVLQQVLTHRLKDRFKLLFYKVLLYVYLTYCVVRTA